MKSHKIYGLVCVAVVCLLAKTASAKPEDFHERYRAVLNLLGSQQYQQAIPLLKEIIGERSSFSPAYHKLFFAYKMLGQLDEAEEYFLAIQPESGLSLWGLGLIEMTRGDFASALGHFKQSAARHPECPDVYESIAVAFVKSGQPDTGQAYFDKIVTTQAGNAAAWYGLGNWFRLQRKWEKALDSAKRATVSDSTFYRAYYLAGWINQRIANYTDALNLLKKGERFAKAQSDFEQRAKFLRMLGIVQGLRGNIQAALNYAGQALDVFKSIGDKKWIETILGDIGMQYTELGDYTSAETHLRQAYQIAVEIDDRRDQARHLNNSGILFMNTGKYPEAMDIFSQALPLYRELGDKRGEGILLSNYAELYYGLGLFDKAREFQQASLARSRESGDKRSESISLINLGIILAAMGKESQSLSLFHQTLEKSRKIDYKKVETSALEALGTSYVKKGDSETAKSYLMQALQMAQNIREKRHEAMIWNSLGWSELENKNYQESRKHFEQAIALGDEVVDLEVRKTGRTGMAMLLEEQGRYESALSYYRSVIELIEKTRAQLETDRYRLSYFAKEVNIYERIVALLGKLHEQAPAAGYEVQALQYAERAMARSLLDMLDRGNIVQHLDAIPLESKQRLLINRHALNMKHTELSEELSKAKRDSQKVASLKNEIEQLERDESKIENDVYAFGSVPGQQAASGVLSIQQLQRELIGENQVFLKYMFAGDYGYLWLITKEHLHYERLLLKGTGLDSLLALVSPIFDLNNAGLAAGLDHRIANFKPKVLHKLYQALLPASIQKYLDNGKELIIMADHILLHFPFEILVTRMDADGIHYLIENHAISYAPSLSFLQQNLRRKAAPSKTLLAVGNPDYGNEQKQSLVDWVSSLDLIHSVFRGERFRNLPSSEMEAKSIGKLFSDSYIMTGEEANETAFKEIVSSYKYIHIATHFISHEKQPLYSKIVLAQTNHGLDDGFLETYEIYNLHLNAAMVVLSGCNTGRGKLYKGEGLLGVARAFQYAGVPTLIASLWPVDDESTAFLMTKFYGYLKKGLSKNRALRRAKLDMIHAQDKKRDPFYWGAFVLLGNWR